MLSIIVGAAAPCLGPLKSPTRVKLQQVYIVMSGTSKFAADSCNVHIPRPIRSAREGSIVRCAVPRFQPLKSPVRIVLGKISVNAVASWRDGWTTGVYTFYA